MKKSFKAAFLSAVLGPGAGHFYLRRYRRGVILMMSTLSGLVVIATRAVRQAQVIFEKVGPESGTMNFDEIAALVSQTSSKTDILLSNGATLLVLVLWMVGVADAYRIGKETGG